MRDFAKDVQIDRTDLDSELIRQPSLMAYWGEKLHELEEKLRDVKISFDAYEAEMRFSLRQTYKAKGERVSEDLLDAECRRQPGWQRQKKELNAAELAVNRVKSHLNALSQKKDMLITLVNLRKQEMRSLGLAA